MTYHIFIPTGLSRLMTNELARTYLGMLILLNLIFALVFLVDAIVFLLNHYRLKKSVNRIIAPYPSLCDYLGVIMFYHFMVTLDGVLLLVYIGNLIGKLL
jgi:hypothetical protein